MNGPIRPGHREDIQRELTDLENYFEGARRQVVHALTDIDCNVVRNMGFGGKRAHRRQVLLDALHLMECSQVALDRAIQRAYGHDPDARGNAAIKPEHKQPVQP